jgi:hypothetical protein
MKMLFALLMTVSLFAAGPVGPVAGWVLDSRSSTIRAVTGLPGALRLADAVTLPFGLTSAEFSPSADRALVLTADTPAHVVVLKSLHEAAPVIADLGEVAAGTRILGVNAKGTAALLYAPTQNELRFLSGLDRDPVLSSPVSTASLAGGITAGILDDAGQCAVLGTGVIETLCADGSTSRVLSDTTFLVTALAFANSGRDLVIADAAGKQIVRINSYAQVPAVTVLASASNGLARPIALAVLSSGQILVADADSQTILAIDPSTGAVLTTQLDIVPTQLRPLADRSLLLLNDLSALPFTLLATEAMRTYFVPAN